MCPTASCSRTATTLTHSSWAWTPTAPAWISVAKEYANGDVTAGRWHQVTIALDDERVARPSTVTRSPTMSDLVRVAEVEIAALRRAR